MTTHADPKDFQRLLLRQLVEMMIDLAALKMLILAQGPEGRRHLETAIDAARATHRILLETLDQTSPDVDVLALLRAYQGPPQ